MLESPRINFVLLYLVGATLLLSPGAAAQTPTGAASGQVMLCSVDTVGSEPQRKEEGLDGVKVCAFWETSWDRTTSCAKCKYPECEQAITHDGGQFSISGLNEGSWVFVAVKKDTILKKTFRLRVGFVKAGIQGGDKATSVDPDEPPPPLWLKPTNCPDLSANGFNQESRGDVVASAIERQRGPVNVVLVLYESEQQDVAPAAVGQGGTTLSGTVVDTTSTPIQGAEVFISAFGEDEDPDMSAFPKPTPTNENGEFSLTLPSQWEAGTYIFSVTKDGFHPFIGMLEKVVPCLSVPPSSHEKCPPGAQGDHQIILTRREELHEGPVALLEKFEATRRNVFKPEVMQALPLPGTRSFDALAFLAPGVLPPPETFGGVGPGVSAGVGTAGQFSVNGLRSRENNFTADGSDNNDEEIGTRRQGFIMTVPQPIESVKELQVITALGDARYGRNIGGQVNVLTKTGGAGIFHGTLYGFATANRFNARDPFDQTAQSGPPSSVLRRASDGVPVLLDGAPLVRQNPVGGKDNLRRVQAGLSAGGQLKPYKNTFYFLSAERQDIRADRESHFAVPTVRQRGLFDSGDAGLLLAPQQGPRLPLFPSSVPGDAIFSLYPFPNNPAGPYGANTYSAVLPADGHGTRFSFKLDHQFAAQQTMTEHCEKRSWWRTLLTQRAHVDQITGRYNFTDETSTLPVTGGAIFSSLRPKVRTQNIAFFVNRTFSATATDTIRFSVGRTRLNFGERRDAALLPSALLPGTPFLLNAPLMLNVTKPNADGSLNAPSFFSASGAQGAALLGSLGYSGVTQTEQITGPLGQVIIPGFSPLGVDTENFPQTRGNNTYQIADTVTWFRKKNLFTFGFDWRTTYINSTLNRNFRPRALFDGLPSAAFVSALLRPDGTSPQAGVLGGASLAAAGVPTGFFQALAPVPDSSTVLHFRQFSVFFQDQRRVTTRLYVTAGMRYNFNNLPEAVSGQLKNASDPAEIGREAQQAATLCNSVRCNDLVPALTSAFPANFSESFGGADRSGFDGRIGFAWAPKKFGPTVIRGGFGKYSGQFPGVVIDQSRNAFPAFLPVNLANFSPRSGNQAFLFNLANPSVRQLSPDLQVIAPGTLNQLSGVSPVPFLANQLFNLGDLSLSPTVLGLGLVLPERRLMMPYSLQYGLTVEHQFRNDYLLSVAYVGTRGIRLLRLETPDLGTNDTRFAGPVGVSPLTAGAPFPFFSGQILPPQTHIISQSFAISRTFFGSSSQSTYNSLQAEFRKRYSRVKWLKNSGVIFGSALTYSHSIDDASDFFDNAGAFALPQDSLDLSQERAPSNYDVRLRSVTHFVYDLPFHRALFGKMGGVKASWQLAGIFTAQGGQPYTVNSAIDVNRDGNLTDRLNTTAGILRGSTDGDSRIQLRLAPGVSPRDLLAPEGFDGAVGRNTFRAPAVNTFDMSVTDILSFKDNNRLLLRVEFFNLFNRANYGIPVRILESPAFGTSVSTVTSPRTIQFAGKFQF
jgi:hypothetical protein